MDADSFFAYTTVRNVTIRDRYLGIIFNTLVLGAVLWVLVIQILYSKAYTFCEAPVGTVSIETYPGIAALSDQQCADAGRPRASDFYAHKAVKESSSGVYAVEAYPPHCDSLSDDRDAAADAEACVDDPDGLVVGFGLTCSTLLSMVEADCSANLNAVEPSVPEGWTPKDLCPLSCDSCGAGEAGGGAEAPGGPIRIMPEEFIAFAQSTLKQSMFCSARNDNPLVLDPMLNSFKIPHSKIIGLRDGSIRQEYMRNLDDVFIKFNPIAVTSSFLNRRGPDWKHKKGMPMQDRYVLVDPAGNTVHKCSNFGKAQWRIEDSCDAATLALDQPCEWSPGDFLVVPVTALVHAAGQGWVNDTNPLDITGSQAMTGEYGEFGDIIRICEEMVSDLGMGGWVSDESFENLAKTSYLSQHFVSLWTGVMPPHGMFDIPFDNLEEYRRLTLERCKTWTARFTGIEMLLSFDFTNMGGSEGSFRGLLQPPSTTNTVTMKVTVAPPEGFTLKELREGDRDWPGSTLDMDSLQITYAAFLGSAVKMIVTGRLCSFSMHELLVTCTSGLSLIVLARFITEFVMTKVLRLRGVYQSEVNACSRDFSDLRNNFTAEELTRAAAELRRQRQTQGTNDLLNSILTQVEEDRVRKANRDAVAATVSRVTDTVKWRSNTQSKVAAAVAADSLQPHSTDGRSPSVSDRRGSPRRKTSGRLRPLHTDETITVEEI